MVYARKREARDEGKGKNPPEDNEEEVEVEEEEASEASTASPTANPGVDDSGEAGDRGGAAALAERERSWADATERGEN